MASRHILMIPDCRRPGEAMAAVPLKLPAEAAAQLQTVASQLGTSRTALGRALVLEGLERLQLQLDQKATETTAA
jgi:hypothetical protein